MKRSFIVIAFTVALLFFVLAVFVATTRQQQLVSIGFGVLAGLAGLAFLRRARKEGSS